MLLFVEMLQNQDPNHGGRVMVLNVLALMRGEPLPLQVELIRHLSRKACSLIY